MTVVINGTSGYIADFSNATVSSRQAFQTSTTNGSTGIYALPNGTSTAASWQATNAADPTNASKILIATNGSTDVQLVSGINGTGTYLPLTFYTNGAEKMRLDTSGNLGIGNTTAASFTQNASNNLAVGTGSASAGITIYTGTSNQGAISFADGTAASDVQYRGFINYAHNIDALLLGSAGAERARIDSSGNLLVGTTSASHNYVKKSISGDFVMTIENSLATNPYVLELIVPTASANDTSYVYWIARNANGTNRAYINGNGGLANYSANNVNLSDRREKTNFAPATAYLDKICAIPVQTFNYIDQNLETDAGLTLGVVAQDVQAVAPELVTESNWGTQEEPKMRLSVYQTDLQYALMKCIQEQQAIITQLQADVAALKGNA